MKWTWYWVGYWVCFVLVFLGSWIYCIATYGFLLGVGLGWLPSAITAGIVSLLWPLILVVAVWGGFYLYLISVKP